MNNIKELDPKFNFDPSWVDGYTENEEFLTKEDDIDVQKYEVIYSKDEINKVINYIRHEYTEYFEDKDDADIANELNGAKKSQIGNCPLYFTMTTNEDVSHSEKAKKIESTLLHVFENSHWDDIKLKFDSESSHHQYSIIIHPVFGKDVEKNYLNCHGYRLNIDGIKYNNLNAKTLLRVSKELLIIDDIVKLTDIDVEIQLTGLKYNSLSRTGGNRMENLKNCKVGERVYLNLTSLNKKNYNVNELNEDSIEVQDKDGKSLGVIPENEPTQTRIAKYLPGKDRETAYTATISAINTKFNPPYIIVHIVINMENRFSSILNKDSD